uniref:Uncharacterized protein n=1 Tax=Aegilops tauschii subsp. strangulata TaxID=200361 RepID=A0A453KSM5_AEGTS
HNTHSTHPLFFLSPSLSSPSLLPTSPTSPVTTSPTSPVTTSPTSPATISPRRRHVSPASTHTRRPLAPRSTHTQHPRSSFDVPALDLATEAVDAGDGEEAIAVVCLDHILKHASGATEEAERIRHCHNTDGSMEYWLEPDELAALRREVGADPYWVPPGWKRGDPVSADCYALNAKMQVEEHSKELAGVKRTLFPLLLSSSLALLACLEQ